MNRISSGIPGLDSEIGGGLPFPSTLLVAGGSGSGKTTFGMQFLFEGANKGEQGLYFTTLSESVRWMLNFIAGYEFVNQDYLGKEVRYVDLSSKIRELQEEKMLGLDFPKRFREILQRIKKEVKEVKPKRVVIDPITTLQSMMGEGYRTFLFELSSAMKNWHTTTILTGDISPDDVALDPAAYISDGIILLHKEMRVGERRYYLEVFKMRGCEHSSHKHPMRITSKGMTVFPRLRMDSSDIILGDEKISIGVKSINKMMGGGVYKGDATLVIGGTGTGKTLLGLHFIKEGIDKGERGLIISLDEFPSALRRNANSFGFDLVPLEEKGLLKIISPSTPDFIPEELISQAEEEWDKVERVFVDSLSRYISSFPDLLEFRDHLLALLSMFKRKGITSLFTLQTGNEIEFQSSGPFFLMDNIISLKYLESGTSVSRAISILKTRGSSHTEETMKLMITRRKMDVKKFERVID